MIIPFLEMRELRFRNIKQVRVGHMMDVSDGSGRVNPASWINMRKRLLARKLV